MFQVACKIQIGFLKPLETPLGTPLSLELDKNNKQDLFLQATTSKYVTRFYRTDPNRTSGKIKLTPPVDSYTIVLQVLTLSTTQTTRGWFLHTSFLGGVECSNGGFRPCEGPGLARVSGLLVDSLIMLTRRVLR